MRKSQSESLYMLVCGDRGLFVVNIISLHLSSFPATKLVSDVYISWILLLFLFFLIPSVSTEVCSLSGGIALPKCTHKSTGTHLNICIFLP